MKRVSIITVNFNQPQVTEALLSSIAACAPAADTEVIVVDNGSSTDPTPRWTEAYPGVTFIRSATNLGFAGGNNLGIRAAKGDYLFLVNNDTEFTPGLVETLADTLDTHPSTAMVSPKIHYYSEPGIIQYAGFTPMNYYTCRNRCIGQFEQDKGQYDATSGTTAFAHGAAMMVRSAAIAKAGLMAENFFLYYEEMDWCERFRKAGYAIEVNMQALIYHKESVSVGRSSLLKEYFMNRNRILFIRRNGSLLQRFVFWIYFLLVVAPRNILFYRRSRQKGFATVLWKAIRWNITHTVDSKDTGWPVKR